MDLTQALAMLLPIAVSAGLNLYLTALVVGASIRLGWLAAPPAGLEALASWPVLAVAAVLFVVEFLADKIQFVDNIWDFFHTFIRPLGAAAIGFGLASGVDPEIALALGMATGGVAFVSHSGKTGSRIALNVASPAENVSNIGVSLLEDLTAATLTYLALQYPLVAAAIALVLLAILAFVGPRLIRWTLFALRALAARVRGIGGGRRQSDPPPAGADLPAPELGAQATGEHISGASGRRGYAAVAGSQLVFLYRRWFRPRRWQIELRQITGAALRRRTLMDVLEIRYQDQSQQPQTARFVFLKDRAALAEQFAARVGAQRG